MTRSFRHWLSAAVFVAPMLSASAQTVVFSNSPAPLAIPRRASIILVVADGLGYGDLSCYGQAKFQTPNLDKLAAEGTRYTQYEGDTDGARGFLALMTGKTSRPISATVAQMLENAGYHTGMVGDWPLGDERSPDAPWKRGFAEFGGYLDENDAKNFYADYIWSFNPNYTYVGGTNAWVEWKEGAGPHNAGREMLYVNTRGKHQYIPDLLTKVTMNFIDANVPDAFNRYRPFFLVVHYPIPGDGKSVVPSDAPYSGEPWPQPQKNKAALVSRFDGYVGQLRDHLAKHGLTNNVALFVTSDAIARGGGGLDPNFFHSNVASNDFRVPLVAGWPGGFPAGAVSDLKCSAKDFLPTAAGIGYAKVPAGVDGVSLLSSAKPK